MKQIHGGQLMSACQRFGGKPQDWLDLSTGIAPWSYPLPSVPEQIWQRLPEMQDGLMDIAAQYYHVNTANLLAVAGSQWAIESIPRLYTTSLRVGLLKHSYAEHAQSWQNTGHQVEHFESIPALCAAAPHLDAAVVVTPNNPLGEILSVETLQTLKQTLVLGILLVDLAFADSGDIFKLPLSQDTWILRSVGKFFGLAGIRLGFVLAHETQIRQLESIQSPWAVNHLARWAGKLALSDRHWQEQQKHRLLEQSQRLQQRLMQHNFNLVGKTDYFVTITHPQAQSLMHTAAEAHILLRHFPDFNGIRFGLPKTEGDWFRLETWLASLDKR